MYRHLGLTALLSFMFDLTVKAQVPASQLLKEPVPITSVQNWLVSNDYPTGAPAGVVARAVNFALTISPDGKVVRCTVERASDFAPLDTKVCSLLEQKGSFSPALDSGGKPPMGIYRGRAIWAHLVTDGVSVRQGRSELLPV